MNDWAFWVTFWKIIASILVCLILTIGGCTSYKYNIRVTAITDAIKAGADPIKVKCAIDVGSEQTVQMCVLNGSK